MARFLAAIIIFLFAVSSAAAQTGSITGIVHGDDGRPLQFARILVAGTGLSAESDADGRFAIRNIRIGRHDVLASVLGYRPATVARVVVLPDVETEISVRLERTPMPLGGIVVSVSRRPEEITRAPAAVTAFSEKAVANVLGNWWAEILKRTPGITITQVGVISSVLNGRGFNKPFNSRWLTIEDGRLALLPETGVGVGAHSAISKIDVAGAEVIAGAGSALYGANAASGILSVRTKDPRAYPGTTAEFSVGTRNYLDAQIRYADTWGAWGYKVTAEVQRAREWDDTVYYSAPGGGAPLREASHDPDPRILRSSGSIRYYFPDGGRVALNAGASIRDGLVQNGQGRFVFADYRYQQVQLEYAGERWFGQAYASSSNAGDTYQLHVLTPTLAVTPSLAYDSALTIAAFPVDGRLLVGEVRYVDVVGSRVRSGMPPIDNMRVTVGGQLRRDRAFSNGRIYTDVFTGRPVIVDQQSFYLQAESPLSRTFRLHAAARYDRSDRLSGRWSPNVALLYDVSVRQTARVTYNEAFVPATMANTDFYGMNRAAGILTLGNSNGFVIKDSAGSVVRTISAVGPETNQTWEAGYRGIFADRLYADVSVYRSEFKGFIGPAIIIANPQATPQTHAYDGGTGKLYADANGKPLQVRSVYNMGHATLVGVDAGLRYYLADALSVSYGLNLSGVTHSMAAPNDPPEVTAFNTSPARMNVSVEGHRVMGMDLILSARYVHGYEFQSAVHRGYLPTFVTLGVSLQRSVGPATTLLLQLNNLATCVGGTSTPPAGGISVAAQATYLRNPACAFRMRHIETPNMPSVGTMLILGVRRG